jgi:hypothetical protein
MITNNILFVGLGNIGVRHFQSICNLKKKYKCFLVDPKIKLIKKKLIKLNKIHELIFSEKIFFDEKFFEFTIISTNSDIRKEIIMMLTKRYVIKNYFIEKVPFTNELIYHSIINRFSKINSKCYVNYVRNFMPCYIDLKNKINAKKRVIVEVYGNDWNLASNSFHFLSLFSYLNNGKKVFVSRSDFSKPFVSKRKNFYEIKGSIEIKTSENDTLLLSDDKNTTNNDCIIIKNDNNIFVIFEDKKIMIQNNTNNAKVRILKFPFLLVSEMTHNIINTKNQDRLIFNNLKYNYKNEIILLNYLRLVFKKYGFKAKQLPIT